MIKGSYIHPQPIDRLEAFLMRLLFAGVVWDFIPWVFEKNTFERPVGIAALGFPMDWLSDEGTMRVFNYAALALLAVYVWGRWLWLITPVLCLMTIPPGTFINSIDLSHGHQIVSLVLMGQSLWFIWFAIRHRFGGDRLERDRGMAFASLQTIVAIYMTTGITKLLSSGLGWMNQGASYYALQIRKTNSQAFHDRLEDVGGIGRSVENYFLDHPTMAAAFLGCGLLLEVGAFVALFGRRWSFLAGVIILAFHGTNSIVMKLNFRFHNEIVIIFLMLPALVHWIRQWSTRRTRQIVHDSHAPGHGARAAKG